MKFFTRGRGIGWLIFGIIVCLSVTETDDMREAISMFLLGLVFIAVFIMNQFFEPRGIGWFIAGGVLGAFLFEEGLTPDGVTTLFIAIPCLAVFYIQNRREIDATIDEIGTANMQDEYYDPYSENQYEEYPEEYAGNVSEEPLNESSSGTGSEEDVEFDVITTE